MIAIVYPSLDLQTHAGIEPANPAEHPLTTHYLFLGQWLVCCFLISLCGVCTAAAQTDRQIAITVDDLPASNAYSMDAATITDINAKIVATLREQKIPAIGFVNENKLYKSG